MMPNYRKDYSLYKRNGVWYYRTYDENGNRTTGRSTGHTNKNLAERFCNNLRAEGKLVPQKVPTLAEWAVERSWWVWGKCKYLNGKLLRSEDGKPAVSRRYADDAGRVLRERILPVHGDKKLDEITPDELDAWMFDWHDEEFKHKTINNWASVYRIMLGEAYRLGLIDENPWDRVPPLSQSTKRRGILTLEEARALLHPLNVDSYWEGNHLAYTINLTAALTALRQGEILAIKTGDVFPDYLHIEHSWHRKYGQNPTKTKIVADVPIPPVLFAQISPYLEYNEPYVFSFDGGKRPYTAAKCQEESFFTKESAFSFTNF
jgi:integrase